MTERWRTTAYCLPCGEICPIAAVRAVKRGGFKDITTHQWHYTGSWTAHVTLACGHKPVIITSEANLAAIRRAAA